MRDNLVNQDDLPQYSINQGGEIRSILDGMQAGTGYQAKCPSNSGTEETNSETPEAVNRPGTILPFPNRKKTQF